MKKLSILLMAIAGLAIACGPSGDDDDDSAPFTLTDGTYVMSNAAVAQDGCQFGTTPGDLNGQTVTVAATETSVDIDFGNGPVTLNRSGNSLDLTTPSQIDLNGNGIDCILDSSDVLTATVTANDAFSLTEALTLSENSGAECANTGLTFPCTSEISIDLNLQ